MARMYLSIIIMIVSVVFLIALLQEGKVRWRTRAFLALEQLNKCAAESGYKKERIP